MDQNAALSSVASGSFRLLRALLVDSLAPSKVVEFDLEGGAVITGENGRGKTSMLSLIMMFYGTNPTQLVSKGKSSFIEYYLPRQTSYVAFEYELENGDKRLVVSYANSTGDKVFYRFVRQGYDKDMFIQNDALIKARDFRSHLAFLKVPCSAHQIETYADYRAIIQYNIPTGGDRSHKLYLKELCADYAFTRYNKPLANMDRLALGMFSKESNFEVLQSIVIESMFDNMTSHSIKTDKSKIEQWPRNFRAYTSVMNLLPIYEESCKVKMSYEQDIKNLSGLREQIDLLISDFNVREDRARDELSSTNESRHSADDAYKVSSHALETKKLESDILHQNLKKKIEALDTNKDNYDKLDIPAKTAEFKGKGNLEAHCRSLEDRLRALTESNLPIVAKFDVIKSKIRDLFSEEMSANSLKVSEARAKGIEKLNELKAILDEQEAKLEALYEDKRRALSLKIEHLNLSKGVCQQNLSNPQVPQELIDAQAHADSIVTEARESYDAVHLLSQEKSKDLSSAKLAVDEAKIDLKRVVDLVAAQEEKVEQTIRDNTPSTDSLLFFLREEFPDWRGDIARVIRPDILHRNDLSPIMAEKGSGIFGMELNLANLDPTPESDADAIAELVLYEERKLAGLREKLEASRSKLSGLERIASILASEHSELSRKELQAKSSVQIAEANKKKALFEVDQAKKSAKEMAKSALDEADKKLETARIESKSLDDRERQEKLVRKNDRATKERLIAQDTDAELNVLANSIKAREIKRDLDLQRSERECEEALREQGVDTVTLKLIADEIESTKESIKRLDDLVPVLNKWTTWYEEEYAYREAVYVQMTEQDELCKSYVESISILMDDHKVNDSLFAKKIEALEQTLSDLSTMMLKAIGMSERLKGFVSQTQYSKLDATWTIDSLSLLMQQWLYQHDEHSKAIDRNVSTLKKGFEKFIGSHVQNFYDDYRQVHGLEHSIGYMGLFDAWYQTRHKEVFSIIRSIATVFSSEVADFYRKLKSFSEQLGRFNRDLQDHLQTLNNYFDAISGLVINIHSTVDELKSWGIIKSMVDSRSSWINSEENLPNDVFLECLEQLLEQWDIKNGITADFKHLISVRGEVVEKGNLRKFKRREDLKDVSSHGLSYLILIIMFVAFWKKIKKDSPVNLIWTLDELKVISAGNIDGLMRMLKDNNISLVSAFPDPDVTTLSYFKHQYIVDNNRKLVRAKANQLPRRVIKADSEDESSIPAEVIENV